MNIGVHVSLSILVSSVCMPSSGISGFRVEKTRPPKNTAHPCFLKVGAADDCTGPRAAPGGRGSAAPTTSAGGVRPGGVSVGSSPARAPGSTRASCPRSRPQPLAARRLHARLRERAPQEWGSSLEGPPWRSPSTRGLGHLRPKNTREGAKFSKPGFDNM